MRTRHLLTYCLAASALLLLLPTAASAQGETNPILAFVLTTQCPTMLVGRDYLPTQIVGVVPGGYTLAFDGMATAGLPPGTVIDGLAVVEGPSDPNESLLDGIIAFSVDAPVTVGTLTFGPADIVRYASGSGFSIQLSAIAMGLPESADIDALARTEAGEWIVSFDAPVTAGPWTFEPAELARASAGGLAPFLTGASLGLGPDTNVTGFDLIGPSEFYFTFDAPLIAGTSAFLPGEIVSYAGGSFSSFFRDPQFPADSALTDFSFPPSPGEVPDGFAVPGVPLDVEMVPGSGDIRLTWGAACVPSGTDYAVYEGGIGAWYSHASRLCTTGGATTAVLMPGPESLYYLVVPINGRFEGSYGRNSSGLERPQGAGACRIRKLASPTCP